VSADAEVDVCVVGSANLDLVATTDRLPAAGETVLGSSYTEHPGGKGLNQAVAAARSGARTAMIAAVGNDSAGAQLREVMRADGIDSAGVATLADIPTGRALIGVSATGENQIIVVPGANGRLAVDAQTFPHARVVLAQLEVPIEAVRRAFACARGQSQTTTTVLNPAPASELALDAELLALCDIVVPNEHEVELLGGVDRLLTLGARAVVVTLGSRGAMLHTAGEITHVAPFAVDVVDTTGAGDTFCGALCARLAAGDAIADALRFASAAAALSTTRAGAVPSIPRAAQVQDFVREVQARGGRSPLSP
jgi:ribokinase